jgi:hypothetical protein
MFAFLLFLPARITRIRHHQIPFLLVRYDLSICEIRASTPLALCVDQSTTARHFSYSVIGRPAERHDAETRALAQAIVMSLI